MEKLWLGSGVRAQDTVEGLEFRVYALGTEP